ncbi:MAG: HDOD domain-containing protein, partial [Candidatus Hydrogenedentota bacterium]
MDDSSLPKAIDRIETLPTLPTVLSRILSTVADPDASALDLARHITVDQALTATLLRIVNSAYYSFEREIVRIPDAIVILGFTEVRNLALAATAFEIFPDTDSAYDRVQLWRHSIATAIASDRCARVRGLENPDAYFVAGLLHDVGKVVFDVLSPEKFREAALHAHEQGTRICESERRLFGYDHTMLGAALGQHWHLPALVTTALKDHHAAENDQTLSDSARVVAV